MYGLWPGVAAIAGDDAMLCVPCALAHWGTARAQAVIDGSDTVLSDEGRAHGGYFLAAVLCGSEDCYDIDAGPDSTGRYPAQRCTACGAPLDS